MNQINNSVTEWEIVRHRAKENLAHWEEFIRAGDELVYEAAKKDLIQRGVLTNG